MDDNTQLTVPTLSVDSEAPVDERLTTNAIHNLIDRYAKKNRHGELEEDWDDVFERVATNIAVADVVHHPKPVKVTDVVLADWVDRIDWDEHKEMDPQSRFFAPEPGSNLEVSLTEDMAPYVDGNALLRELDDVELEAEFRGQRDRYEELMRARRFMPNSPTLMNAGDELQQLSACFVDTPKDDMLDINETATEAAEIFHSGGGMGYAFHKLRPKGARVGSTGGVSSGPISFMQIYDTVCGTIQQGGARRGAQMGIMHAHHPDIGRFVVAKRGEENLSNFNISVGVTDEFVDAVRNDEMYTLYDPTYGLADVATAEPQDVLPQSVHFYDPQFEDAGSQANPEMGLNNDMVEANFWRDFQAQMQDPSAFDEFRDRIDLEVGEPLEVPARFIWQMMIDGGHNNGEPGLFYIDETNRQHTFDVSEHPEHYIHATNPCGEQPLQDYEACNLGHINLSLLADEERTMWADFDSAERHRATAMEEFVEQAVEVDRLRAIARDGTQFLDNVVTMSRFPLPEIRDAVKGKRKIGLGLMGFAQLCVQVGIEYGSEESFDFAREIMRRIDMYGTERSHELAKKAGSFSEWDESKWSDPQSYPDWFDTHGHDHPDAYPEGYPIRNRSISTIAPTGTTSMIGDTSGGCEPIYNVVYYKNVSDDVQGEDMLVEWDDYFLQTLAANDIPVADVKKEAKELMANNEFEGIDDLSLVPDDLADLFVVTSDLSADQHIQIQSAFQDYCDSGISKTCNLPNDATIADVGEAYGKAIEHNIKGLTVYRDGSRDEQVLTTRQDNKLDDDITDDQLLEELEARVGKDDEFAAKLDDALADDERVAVADD